MVDEVHYRLQRIEDAFFDGAAFGAMREKIAGAVALIAQLNRNDPIRKSAEAFAPLLWGAAAGSPIEPAVVNAALAGTDGEVYMRSWSNVRGLLAFRIAA